MDPEEFTPTRNEADGHMPNASKKTFGTSRGKTTHPKNHDPEVTKKSLQKKLEEKTANPSPASPQMTPTTNPEIQKLLNQLQNPSNKLASKALESISVVGCDFLNSGLGLWNQGMTSLRLKSFVFFANQCFTSTSDKINELFKRIFVDVMTEEESDFLKFLLKWMKTFYPSCEVPEISMTQSEIVHQRSPSGESMEGPDSEDVTAAGC
eukprot:GHVP01002461.1.p1 GENE.GHVP01002461.1~~GHVP01002461.1.p1  ORF type:complete len:208 (+),score=46.48 GHVP01002461.1:3-626(+)